MQLYINNELADLADDSPIALTFQINNLAEVKNQQGNTSNQFKLPLTQRNRRILGFPDDIAFATTAPYNNYPAKIIQDGLEIVPYGLAVLNGIEHDGAAITVLSGNVDFFDAISGKIYEMGDKTTPYGASEPFKPYEHIWNVQNVVASQTHTTGYIWPIVDYGNLVYNFAGQCEVNVRHLRPGFFIKTAIDAMVASVGYKATGSLLSDPLYPKLIAQFSNDSFDHGTDYQNAPAPFGLQAYMATNFERDLVINEPTKGNIQFNAVNSDPAHQFSNSEVFTANQINSIDIRFTIPNMYYEGRNSGDDPSYLKISIYKNDSADSLLNEQTFDLTNSERIQGTSGNTRRGYIEPKNTVISAQTELAIGNQVTVRYEFFRTRPQHLKIFAGASLEITPTRQGVLYGQDIQCERIFPDITQKDLLKDVLQRFGIICQTDANARTINFASFGDIVSNMPVANNWTKKALDQGKSIYFQLGSYAQANTMKHKEDDAILPKDFGNAQINVTDKTLPATAELFESQFVPTLNRTYIGGTVAQIRKIDEDANDSDFSIGTQPRILIDQKLDLAGKQTIKFTDGNPGNDVFVNGVIATPYFYKPDGEYSLCFGDMPGTGNNTIIPGLKSSYYPQLEKILQQTKKVIRYFMLTPLDILQLDLLIPVYLEQDSAYYYINKIDSWRKGQPVKVELVRL